MCVCHKLNLCHNSLSYIHILQDFIFIQISIIKKMFIINTYLHTNRDNCKDIFKLFFSVNSYFNAN